MSEADDSRCQSTMTFGSGSREFDSAFAKFTDQPDIEWPVHRCELPAGHNVSHKCGEITWTGTAITVPLSWGADTD